MFGTKVVEKIKTQILCSITFFFFFPEDRVVYEMMWRNKVELDMSQMTLQYDTCALHAG